MMTAYMLNQNNDIVTLTTAEIELSFSRDDGGLRELRRVGGPNVLGYGDPHPSIDVQVGADRVWLADHVFVRYLQHSVDERDGGVELVIVVGIGSLMLYDRYRITGTLIARRVSAVNVSDDELQLHHVRLSLPWACIGHPETCRFEAPGNRLRSDMPLMTVAVTQHEIWQRHMLASEMRAELTFEPAPTYAPGLLALHNAQVRETLLCWYQSDTALAQPSIQSNGRALTLLHDLELADWLRAGVALSGGTQYILLLAEPWAAALNVFRQALVSLKAPQQAQHADWTDEIVLYEVHPAAFGGFAGLQAQLAWLHELGVTTLCLLPIWTFENHTAHAWDGNWDDTGDPYAVSDFECLDETLGGEHALRALVDSAHAFGMRVLVDLPVFGCSRASHYIIEHPDWFCHDESGGFADVAGRDAFVCFDWSNKALQKYFVSQMIRQAQAYDLDGYRIVPDRMVVPNWERQLSTHASGGALEIVDVVAQLRNELQVWKPCAGIVTPMSGPNGVAVSAMCVDELAHQHFFAMLLRRMTPHEMGTWLTDNAAIQPVYVPRICFVESHQTRLQTPLADGLRGSPLGRMGLAAMVLCGYVPLIRPEQAWTDEHFVRRLLHMRAHLPALRYGRVWYNSVAVTSGDVFVVVRKVEEQTIIGVMNVGPHKRAVTLTVPADKLQLEADAYTLFEALSGFEWDESEQRTWTREQLSHLTLTLEPFGTYFFVVQPVQKPSGFQPSAAEHSGAVGRHTSVHVPAHSDLS